MIRFLSLLLCLSLSPAWAQEQDDDNALQLYLPPQYSDPYVGPEFEDHYQRNLTQDVQETLEDCFWFEVEAIDTPSASIQRKLVYYCTQIALKNANAIPMSESERALENLILDYEEQARAWAIDVMTQNGREHTQNSLIFSSGWYALKPFQFSLLEKTALDMVLDTFD